MGEGLVGNCIVTITKQESQVLNNHYYAMCSSKRWALANKTCNAASAMGIERKHPPKPPSNNAHRAEMQLQCSNANSKRKCNSRPQSVIPDRKTQFQTANVISNADTKYEWPMYNNRTGVTISDRVVTVLNLRASPVPAPPT
jgi:outer membrane protein OmpA-like peptidoglycan-associated protein